jgi:hypothetical protein
VSRALLAAHPEGHIMGQDELDPSATPTPGPPDDASPLRIVEATTPPGFPDVPVSPAVDAGYSDPTLIQPVTTDATARTIAPVAEVAEVRTVRPVAYAPVEPLPTEPRFIADERNPAWLYIIAVLALVVGGLAGYLIGAASDDEQAAPSTVPADGSDVNSTFDMLLTRTRTDGEYKSPSEYPQLDEITAIDAAAATADLENQVAMLTVAQEEAAGLTDQVALLETALADVTAERDELTAQLGESGGTNTDTQVELDAANEQIATLTSDLEAARTELDAANAALETAETDLAAANAALAQLNVMEVPSYVNGDVARARSDAAANGWTLIEQPTDSNVAVGTVLDQLPAAQSNMIEGSVLHLTVAANL